MIKTTKLYATKGRSAIQTIYKQEQDHYHPLTLAYSTSLKMKLGFDLNLEYVPEYFDATIDNL
jgi:hypothetical protein